jgi:hypothetical protein
LQFYDDTTGSVEAHILHNLQKNIITFCKIACEILKRLRENVRICPEFSQANLDNF